MQDKSKNTEKELARIPQSLGFDHNALTRTYGNEGVLIRDILIFVSKCQMKNLFGEVEFSMADFCREMGYNRTTLQRTLQIFKENPQMIPEVDGLKMDSLFEYALFRALKEKVVFRRRRENRDTIESISIIDEINIQYQRHTQKRTKRIYSIKLGAKVLDYLFTEYNLIDFNDYKGLSSQQISVTGSMRNFYIFMARVISHVKFLRKQGRPEQFVLSVDDLCEIFSVCIDTPKNKKIYITRTLKTLKKSISNLQFDWKYTKNGTKYAYFVEFQFPAETLDYFDEQLKATFFKSLYENLKRTYIFSKQDKEEGFNYSQELKDLDREKYMQWFFKMDKNIEGKRKIFYEIYERTFGVPFNPENNLIF